MAFQLSPGVLVVEKDLTNIVPAVSTSIGAFAGTFAWGPVLDPILLSSENELVAKFGKPTVNSAGDNSTSFFTAANYLAYSNALYVCRRASDTHFNAASTADTSGISGVVINNEDAYLAGNGTWGDNGEFAAKYPGKLGNSLRILMADSSTWDGWGTTAEDWAQYFDRAPGTSQYVLDRGGSDDELHILIIDELGYFSGVKGTILEKYSFLSKASDAKAESGALNYYADVLNNDSKYVWWLNHTDGGTNWGTTAENKTFDDMTAEVDSTLVGGVDDLEYDSGKLQTAFALYSDVEKYDISLVITGALLGADSLAVVGDLGDERKDCIVFISPTNTGPTYFSGDEAVDDTLTFRNNTCNVNSSYAVMDSGWGYQYDVYNDKYKWIPLNGHVAGLCARTDNTNDPWWSPGGLNRGQLKNVIKLNINPNKTQRDSLYKIGVNPIVSFPGQGTILYGDKTLLTRPSAFDRINVRRLFIVLEKAIATAAKYQLFEFNDSFTRAQFRSMVEPFLRGVQGRRGLIDFRVVCDETNNTGDVIDRNEFVASIFIKPTRSINFITLNFVAVRTDVSFDEVTVA